MLSEDAFLSPYGLRALSRRHRDAARSRSTSRARGRASTTSRASRTTDLFGGNSNWRGPVWFPLNYLVIESLSHWDDWFGRGLHGRAPHRLRAAACACGTSRATWRAGWSASGCPATDGRRPVYGAYGKLGDDPEWRDLLPFHEYFHGDTGAGLGASHQTGWTGLVAHLLARGATLNSDKEFGIADVLGRVIRALENPAAADSWSPPGAQRQSRRAPVARLGQEQLAYVQLALLEAEPRGGHVDAPRTRDLLACRCHRSRHPSPR